MPYGYKTKAKLTEMQALEIYAYGMHKTGSRSSSMIAKMYNITDRAVRDIWNGRTWYEETSTLLSPAEAALRPKRMRTRGAKQCRSRDSDLNQVFDDAVHKHYTLEQQCHQNFAGNSQMFACIATVEDPFHDDWPYWKSGDSNVTLASW
mmetsp:Transcript_16792/g.45757  ORF Transcript_16792/g.45757 Transcript_16792/m.45757 type:complete len:149 (+) Transcript_16792:79-525(+)